MAIELDCLHVVFFRLRNINLTIKAAPHKIIKMRLMNLALSCNPQGEEFVKQISYILWFVGDKICEYSGFLLIGYKNIPFCMLDIYQGHYTSEYGNGNEDGVEWLV